VQKIIREKYKKKTLKIIVILSRFFFVEGFIGNKINAKDFIRKIKTRKYKNNRKSTL